MSPRDALIATLRREGITDERVLDAMRQVPRERFVPPDLTSRAYDNSALPLTAGQTISQPYVVARMTSALALTGTERVLEVGTGSGYQTAILAHLAAEVMSVERIATLAEGARAALADLRLDNVRIHVGDGSLGCPEAAPFDAILVTAAGPRVPTALAGQLRLAPPGRLVMPLGSRDEQQLAVLSGDPHSRALRWLGPVRFVPLIGDEGWESLP